MSKFQGEMRSARLTLKEALELPIAKGIPERGISEKTCKHYEVRQEYDTIKGEIVAYLFPVRTKGKISGFKRLVRDQHASKKERWSTVGDVTQDSDYLGISQHKPGKYLFITEGEYDMLSLYEVLSRKFDGFVPHVVSLVAGVDTAAPGACANAVHIKKFRHVVTVYDSDEQGQEAVRETALVLPDLYNVVLDLKDSSEYLQSGREQELVDKVLSPVKYELANLVYGGLDPETLRKPLPKGVHIPCFPKLMGKLNGLRPGELTLVLALPKTGKTSLCKEINYELLKAKRPTLGIYLEEDIIKTQQSFIALDNGIHLPEYRANPQQLTIEQVRQSSERILDPKYAMFCDDNQGHINPERLMALLNWAAVKGCQYAILDHISFVFSGMNAKDERKEIDKLMTDLATYVKKTGVHVIAVAHTIQDRNRTQNQKRDKDGSLLYPYWYDMDEKDARGSGAFAQLCWNMIGIDKEITGDASRGDTRLRLMLNREWDRTGICDTLKMKPNGRLESIEK